MNAIISFTIENPALVAGVVLGLAEIITRLTPTTSDDGFVKRLGILIDKLLTLAKVPNNIK
jgi:hypothetical protein